MAYLTAKYSIFKHETLYICRMKVSSNKIGDIRTYYTEQLGAKLPKQEARFMVDSVISHLTNIPRLELPLELYQRVGESLLLKIHFAVKDLLFEKPLQYIIGETEFHGLTFQLNEQVLIPRPETEDLVTKIIKEFSSVKKPLRILDVGTGSGCIAVSLAKNIDAEIFAIDVSPAAIEVAQNNAKLNSVEISFIQLDILDQSDYDKIPFNFDLIVSNPPYVRNNEKKLMKKNVLKYEPELALFVEDDNAFVFYKAISEMAALHLKEDGQLWFEINEYLADETKDIVQSYIDTVHVLSDYKDCQRFLKCIK